MTDDNWLFETKKKNHGTTRTVCFEFLALLFDTHTHTYLLDVLTVVQCFSVFDTFAAFLFVSIC